MGPELPGLVRLRVGLSASTGRQRTSFGTSFAAGSVGAAFPLVAFALSAVLAAAACAPADRSRDGSSPARSQIVVVDAVGTEVVLPEPARRVVSLVPSATQTLRAIGAGDVLVGRTDFDTQGWTAALPSVGGGIGPNLEAVVELRPDLVIRFAAEQDPRTPARLDDLGIRHLAVRPDRVDDILDIATTLGRVTGHETEAEALAASIRDGLRDVAESASARAPLRFAYVLGGTPPWVAGPGTYIDEVVTLAGGVNAFQDLGALYAAVSPEAFRAREIDVVLVGSEAGFDPALAPEARIELVGGILEIPGPDVVRASVVIAEALHGTALR